MRQIKHSVSLIFFSALVLSFTHAQTINLWSGPAPGSEHWTQKEQTIEVSYGKVLINVVTPTLTAFLPEKSKASGLGIIVAPGGSCIALAIDHEGNNVARWLQAHGIAAFVL